MKQFWISANPGEAIRLSEIEPHGEKTKLHVVEYSEYERMKKALEYYADPSNWREHDQSNRPSGMTYKQRISSKDSGHIGPNQYDFGGGKRAREALKKDIP